MMKNHQHIRQLRVKELAAFLISKETVPDYDEGLDGEFYQCGEYVEYISPDGMRSFSYDDAILHTIDWLNADHK